ALAEAHADRAFEARLLDHYNQTMESRRVDGQATGGAYSGRRLLAMLPELGFTILLHGGAGWGIWRLHGPLRRGRAVCLVALLDMIFSEGQRGAQFRPDSLRRWHDERQRLVREGRLALRVHHVDVLARYDP